MKVENYIGKTYNRLTIIENNGLSKITCICLCGNIWIGKLNMLKRGLIKSCGCYQKEIATSHGLTHSSEYYSWKSMKGRCLNKNNPQYKNYGGRGITICKEWLQFENFLKDMQFKPSKDYSIERIDNNLGYFKENCRWATRKEQQNNRRNNKLIAYKGKLQNLTDWCKELNLNYSKTYYQLYSLKHPIEKLFKNTLY